MDPVHGVLESLKKKHVLENDHAVIPCPGNCEAIDFSTTSTGRRLERLHLPARYFGKAEALLDKLEANDQNNKNSICRQ